MKAGWKEQPLGDVIDLVSGQHIDAKDYNTDGRGVGYLTGPSDFGTVHPVVSKWTEKPKRFAKSGDILLTVKGSGVGKTNLLDGEQVAISRQIMAVRAKGIDAKFLHLLLQSLNEHFASLANGAAIPGISRTDVTGYRLPLPPLHEQQRIVALLDEAFEGLARARANAEANFRNARELFESFLGAVFTKGADNSRPLQDLVEDDCSLSYGIVQPGDEVAAGLPIVRPTDLGRRVITLEGLKAIDPAKASGYARTKLKGTEILLCVRGSTGVLSMASSELAGANVTRGIVPIRFNSAVVDQRFGYFQFLSKYVQDQIRAGTYGAALMQINIRDLRQLSFIVSPMDQQIALVERLESVSGDFDQLLVGYERKVSEIRNLRQSLLQKAFAGELT